MPECFSHRLKDHFVIFCLIYMGLPRIFIIIIGFLISGRPWRCTRYMEHARSSVKKCCYRWWIATYSDVYITTIVQCRRSYLSCKRKWSNNLRRANFAKNINMCRWDSFSVVYIVYGREQFVIPTRFQSSKGSLYTFTRMHSIRIRSSLDDICCSVYVIILDFELIRV